MSLFEALTEPVISMLEPLRVAVLPTSVPAMLSAPAALSVTLGPPFTAATPSTVRLCALFNVSPVGAVKLPSTVIAFGPVAERSRRPASQQVHRNRARARLVDCSRGKQPECVGGGQHDRRSHCDRWGELGLSTVQTAQDDRPRTYSSRSLCSSDSVDALWTESRLMPRLVVRGAIATVPLGAARGAEIVRLSAWRAMEPPVFVETAPCIVSGKASESVNAVEAANGPRLVILFWADARSADAALPVSVVAVIPPTFCTMAPPTASSLTVPFPPRPPIPGLAMRLELRVNPAFACNAIPFAVTVPTTVSGAASNRVKLPLPTVKGPRPTIVLACDGRFQSRAPCSTTSRRCPTASRHWLWPNSAR